MKALQAPPRYPHKPISSLEKLSLVLAVPVRLLLQIANVASSRYRLAKPIVKADGSLRQTFDAEQPLKRIQQRIKQRILDKVIFPDYLTGSLKGRDARANAELHVGAAIVVCEDIADFFPSVSSALVKSVWEEFFHFSPEVAELLTLLTTKDGSLPQGACTSSHLANLAFWKDEHALYQQLFERGIAYSRYVDDVAASSKIALPKEELSTCIASIYTMMGRAGFKPKRRKQEIQRANKAMRVTKLVTNRRPAITASERSAIRASVFQLEKILSHGEIDGLQQLLDRASGRVNRLSQLHPVEGRALKARVRHVREAVRAARMP